MAKLHNIASYIVNSYEKNTGNSFNNSELLLHKLLYFSQRHSFALTGEKLIEEDFKGWKNGPVIMELRHCFKDGVLPRNSEEKLSNIETYIIDNTILDLKDLDVWSIVEKSHEELSWKNSRIGIPENRDGNKTILNSDIQLDAGKVRIYDHVYDMYIDEFEEFEEELLAL